MATFQGQWQGTGSIPSQSYVCGHCDHHVAAATGWWAKSSSTGKLAASLAICHQCNRPSLLMIDEGVQIPGPKLGLGVASLPPKVDKTYREARDAGAAGAFSAGALMLRNLISFVAHDQGAGEDLNYAKYVDWLVQQHLVPPVAEELLDKIRTVGNAAAHDLVHVSKDEYELVLDFAGQLLRWVYEAPSKLKSHAAAAKKGTNSAKRS